MPNGIKISDLGLEWNRLQAIYLTHFHPGHYGAAGWLQENPGPRSTCRRPEGSGNTLEKREHFLANWPTIINETVFPSRCLRN